LLQRSYGDVVGLLAASGMTLTPTISIGGFQLMALRHPDLLADRRIEQLFPSWTVRAARTVVERAGRGGLEVREARAAAQAATVLAITRAGGRVIAGTDLPIMPYALSLHTELEHFVDGGLTPFEALQTATVNAAAALGSSGYLGTLEPGTLADLVIVEGNPLRDITHTRRVRAVMKNGSLFELESLLGTRGAGPATLQR
jgi:imidazolonepropionase-like amidohydrolase